MIDYLDVDIHGYIYGYTTATNSSQQCSPRHLCPWHSCSDCRREQRRRQGRHQKGTQSPPKASTHQPLEMQLIMVHRKRRQTQSIMVHREDDRCNRLWRPNDTWIGRESSVAALSEAVRPWRHCNGRRRRRVALRCHNGWPATPGATTASWWTCRPPTRRINRRSHVHWRRVGQELRQGRVGHGRWRRVESHEPTNVPCPVRLRDIFLL